MTLNQTRRLALGIGLGAALLAPTALLAQAQKTIELWTFLDPTQDNSRSKALKHVITTFEAANPTIKIKASVIQWQEISPQLLRGARAGRVPDVVMLYSPNLQTHIAAGTLSAMDDQLAKTTPANDLVIFPEAKDAKGQTYAVPWEMRVHGVMYRKDLLDKAGLAVPKTLPELVEVAGKLGAEGRIGMGLGFKSTNPDAGMAWFIPTAVAMGAKIIKDDGTPEFNSPPMVRLISLIHDMVHKQKIMTLDAALMGDSEVQQFAEGGRTVFIAKATHRLQFIREKSGLGDNYQMMEPLGLDPKVKAPAFVSGWTLGVPKASPNRDAALKLIAHWTSAEMQLFQATEAGYLPVRRSIATSPAIAKSPHIGWALEYAAQNPLKFNWPDNPDFLNATLARAVEQVVSNKATPAEALAAAEKAYRAGAKP